jgi:cytochrome c oxidase subunit 2
VNRPVILVMRTRDVIHSFFVREFRVKQDVTPGMVNRAWFQATKEGDYEIGCAELCGAEHWTMRALLQVRSQEEFDAEIARRSEAAVEFEHDFNNPAEVWPWVETQKATGRARREAAAKKDGDEQR